MACGFVATRFYVVFVANAMAVGGAKLALEPLSFDGCLQLREVESFFLCGRDGVADGAVAADAVATSYS